MELLERDVQAAVAGALGPDFRDVDPLVRPAQDPRFGDFQSNVAMGLAKRAGRRPRELADAVVDRLRTDAPAWLSSAGVAGPGFINLTLAPAAVVEAAAELVAEGPSPRLGSAGQQRRSPGSVVVDYGGPNLAKEMHVGHLRSSVIGDALSRVLEATGEQVVRQNHIGDWGTQFGMLLEHLIRSGWEQDHDRSISDLNRLYQEAKRRFDDEPEFAEAAKKRVVALQAGEREALRLWQTLIGESQRHMNEVFGALGVRLTDDDIRPESFYNDRLAAMCEDLEHRGIARVSEGALCVFVEGEEAPLIIRKSDGGYGYATTDLAAIRFRVDELGARRLIYVVDARQQDHFRKVFAAARAAGYADTQTRLDYVPFGTVLGPDKRPFKTRSGDTVKLQDLLEEAVQRAAEAVAARNADLDADERAAVAEAVGIGAVKYGDLSNDRIKNYVFDWNRMLALEGNTAPYLQYSYARIRSIFRKAGTAEHEAMADAGAGRLPAGEAAERGLLLHLIGYGDTVASVAESLEPHRLAIYLYDLATRYHRFYEACPVLKDGVAAELRQQRLALCAMVATVLRHGLELLGIRVVDRM